jgi:hypothetical protein
MISVLPDHIPLDSKIVSNSYNHPIYTSLFMILFSKLYPSDTLCLSELKSLTITNQICMQSIQVLGLIWVLNYNIN